MKKVIKGLVIIAVTTLAVWMFASYVEALSNSLTVGATVSDWNFFAMLGQ